MPVAPVAPGGAVPMAGGIVLSLAGMRKIREINSREGIAIVGPGVVLGDLHAAVEGDGWFCTLPLQVGRVDNTIWLRSCGDEF